MVEVDLDAHWPSMTDDDEHEILDRSFNMELDRLGESRYGAADYALRTCRCGKAIDGFDEFMFHLKEVANA